MDFPMNFIAATKEYTTFDKHVPAPFLRKSFRVDSEFDRAELLICGLGFYDLYLNGNRLTKGPLAPYVSAPDDLLYYDRYDAARYLKRGQNVIGVILGNGMQNAFDGYTWNFEKAGWRGAPETALRLEVKNGGDAVVTIESDESFKTSSSPITFDGMRTGEYYDARKEQPGWNGAGFDDSGWADALRAPVPRGEPVLCGVEPIVTAGEMGPVSIQRQGDGYLYDFGVNDAGICRLRVSGAPGQEISLEHGEMLTDGKLNLRNIQFVPDGYVQRDRYICKGTGVETHTPRFTYHGFRYVYVTGVTEKQAVPELLTFVVMHSGLTERGGFACSDETANKLQKMTRRSTVSNFYYFPTDCPQREKNGWTGDAAASCEHTLVNLAAEKSYREWLRGIRKAQREDGALPGIVPTGGWGFAWGNGPAWDRVLVNLPYYTYLYRNDVEILKENATAILRYVNYLADHLNAEGLVRLGLGDWCPPGRGADVYKSPLEFTDSVMSMDICRKASYIFGVLGMDLQKKFADGLAGRLRRNIRERLVDFAAMTAAGDCQTSQAMAIYYDVFENGEKPEAFRRLLEMIENNRGLMDTGYLGARVIFHVLSAYGKSDLAFRMITTPEFPSYGYWVAQGNTALCELFQKEPGGSLNHHFFGDISSWFIKWVAGIQLNPHRNNVQEVDLRPSFIGALSFAKGFHIAPAGKIISEWKRENGGVTLTVEVPETMDGQIRLDGGYLFAESGLSYAKAATGTYKIIKA